MPGVKKICGAKAKLRLVKMWATALDTHDPPKIVVTYDAARANPGTLGNHVEILLDLTICGGYVPGKCHD